MVFKHQVKKLLVIVLILLQYPAGAQHHTFTFTLTGRIGFILASGPLKSMRMGLGCAVQYTPAGKYKPSVTYQNSFNLYRGDMGASVSRTARSRFELDWINGFSFLAPVSNKTDSIIIAPTDLMGIYQLPAAYNYHLYYLALSTNYVHNSHRKGQWVGQGLLRAGPIQFCYYNDGTPWNWFGLGDALDRWWTGGGFLRYRTAKNCITLAYDKFTGHSPWAFEVSNILGLNQVYYHSGEEACYSRSVWTLGFEFDTGFEVFAKLYDNDVIDVQNIIHNKGKMSFHTPVLPSSFGIGGSYNYYQFQQTSIKTKNKNAYVFPW